MSTNKENKVYNVSLVSYAPLSFIEDTLKFHISQLKAYSFCFHDKDEGKKPHTHIVICSKMPLKVSTYCNWFNFVNDNGLKEQTLGEKCIDVKSSFNYLCHLDNPEKFQYPIDDRIVFNPDFFDHSSTDDLSVLALTDLLSGCSIRETALKYGKSFIYHYSHFRSLLIDIGEQEGISLFSNKKNESR